MVYNFIMENLKNLRENKLRISQKELAKLLGISQQAYSTYENDTRTPPLDILKKLAGIYDCSVDELINNATNAPIINQNFNGNRNLTNTITINGNEPRKLTEIECEILKVCNNLDTRGKNALLNSAYEIENKNNNN